MSAAALLADLQARGVCLKAEGERLIYDAPQGVMKPADLDQLRKHKSELLAYLHREAANTIADPDGLCPDCGSGQWWQLPGQAWHCRACEPDMPLSATTLTLPCHKVELRPVAAPADLRAMIEAACQGLSITPERLRRELEENGDIPYLVSGVFTPAALRLTADTLSNMRYGGEALKSNTPANATHRAVQQLYFNELSATA